MFDISDSDAELEYHTNLRRVYPHPDLLYQRVREGLRDIPGRGKPGTLAIDDDSGRTIEQEGRRPRAIWKAQDYLRLNARDKEERISLSCA